MVFEFYCIDAQDASMMLNKDKFEQKYDNKKENVEVVMDKPYYSVSHKRFEALPTLEDHLISHNFTSD